ncbi:Vga family ABC-F type ribosomal protection protein [Jeotgalibacillus proteolyticus]|uniref:ABC transporter domain-containing protein n=1 Tax=Jeotgalibacillus proteolyticus TaxID=2082395 RepID=A0A2S5GCL9_9BACL|nr:ABC-F type ribosomal protection protein [Jeotgalibacillus proteolyticus]PPA70698.1 hypothetical protein C4B60_07835 [Jeotgalibacillus proteolyticus]
MVLLEANNLKKTVRDRLLFDIEQLRIQPGDRIGLVGSNGSGKTTLLEILAGKQKADEGTIDTYSKSYLLPQLKRTDTVKSGGEITQEYINQALAAKTEILFADEPTTNLDTLKLAQLEKRLKRFSGALVLVSHDRAFLDHLCKKIWEIEDGKVEEYKGNYTAFTDQKELKKRQHEEAFDQYMKKKKQLEEAIAQKEQRAERATVKPKNGGALSGFSSPYFAKKQKKLHKTASALETKLEQLKTVEKPKKPPVVKMNLPNEEAIKNRTVLTINAHRVTAGEHLLFYSPSFSIHGGEKVALIGKNGSGKTTFLKEIMADSELVRLSPAAKIGYFSQNLDILNPEKSILENIKETAIHQEDLIRTVLARLHFFREDVYKKVGVLSGGERVKTAFAKVFLSDLNTLILDEPTNYLDIQAVEALEQLLIDFKGTVLFVSHDRRLMERTATRVVEIKDQAMQVYQGSYTEFLQYTPVQQRDENEDERLKLETKISEVLSRLSLEPSEELDQEFKELLNRKNQLK